MEMSPGTAREEAERLVAAVLAAATLAANANPHISTGSAECCICPLCKVIAAVRDPDPELVERVATGAGDLAAGLASFLRAVSTHRPGAADETWRDATAGTGDTPERGSGVQADPAGAEPATTPAVKKVAKKIVKKAVAKPTPDVSEPETTPSQRPVKAAKKAVRKAEPHPPPEL
ncbi:hypothetical protein GCM10009679_03780 [Saccharothrix algeriensis]|uniref:Uncharacterized protein n=1 Tax=Catellatospora bangladeshensis TaxID=310355 RepID=A0A8J3JKU9_9ACTN|nr:hypothetical protein [Catellatospora bangladeshensis]GIF78969.1 hypothetical protein Cba03nite_03180 [Catellatospora bangladeshensis]